MSMWSLVTASIDSTLRVWDLRTLQCIQVLHSKQSLTCVSQSEAAGAACARTSFGALCIWDIKSGELILQDDTAMPQIASFIYMDERYIGYGQCDGVVTVFDWSSRTSLEVVGTYHAHQGDVIHISMLDNQYIISASTNGETLVYSLAHKRIMERILLPHATQAIQFTPTIHGDKVMFSTRDAVYEYELGLDSLSSRFRPPSSSTSGPTPSLSPRGIASTSASASIYGGRRRRSRGIAMQPSTVVSPSLMHSHQGSQSQDDRGSIANTTIARSPPTPPPPPPMRQSPAATRSQVALSVPPRNSGAAGRTWKTSNSLLSQIRQRIGTGRREPFQDGEETVTGYGSSSIGSSSSGGMGRRSDAGVGSSRDGRLGSNTTSTSHTRDTEDGADGVDGTDMDLEYQESQQPLDFHPQEREEPQQQGGQPEQQHQQQRVTTIPTRFPHLASLYCLPRTSRQLDHGTTSARDSYGVFMPRDCQHLDEISVYTRRTKRVRRLQGEAVERVLRDAVRNPFYTTMECNQHCAVVSSGNKLYVISFLPLDV
ncbi:hypothetical protein BGZ94_007388 [Podila epigama]|nr:hypothetical protein BGZ94_007388 [Podila epigama]